MLQAFYYKIAADLKSNICVSLCDRPTAASSTAATGTGGTCTAVAAVASPDTPQQQTESADVAKSELKRSPSVLDFSRALRDVEVDRVDVRRELLVMRFQHFHSV